MSYKLISITLKPKMCFAAHNAMKSAHVGAVLDPRILYNHNKRVILRYY